MPLDVKYDHRDFHLSYLAAKDMAITRTIPAIDISPYLDPSSSEEAKQAVIKQVEKACSTYGFLQVKGHGVPIETQNGMLESCKVLFNLPSEQKEALSLQNDNARRSERDAHFQLRLADSWRKRLRADWRTNPRLQSIARLQRSKLSSPQRILMPILNINDKGFYIGREIRPEDAGFLRGPNQWPPLPAEQFHTPVTAYYKEMLRLCNKLIEMLVIALGHPPSVLDQFTREPVMNLKLLHYPPHTSKDPMQFGAGAHTVSILIGRRVSGATWAIGRVS